MRLDVISYVPFLLLAAYVRDSSAMLVLERPTGLCNVWVVKTGGLARCGVSGEARAKPY